MHFVASFLLGVTCLLFVDGVALGQTAEFQLPSVLSSGCVLQRNTRVPLWGKGPPRQAVSVQVSWSQKTYSGKVRSDGNWWIPIPTPNAGGPYTIAFRCMKTNVLLEDVLIGEVWVCSGQSNMEMPIAPIHESYTGVENFEQELKGADFPELRVFTVPNTATLTPQLDCDGSWQASTPESAGMFGATGYFFGRELQRELEIPIGLIEADYGGSRAEAWMSAQGLGEVLEFEDTSALLVGASDDEHLLQELQSEAVNQFVNEIELRDGWVQREWASAEDFQAKDSWSGLLWGRFEVEVDPDQGHAVVIDLKSREGRASLPVEFSLAGNERWISIYVNGLRVGVHNLTLGTSDQPTRIQTPDGLLRVGKNEVLISMLAGSGKSECERLRSLCELNQVLTDVDAKLPMAAHWRFARGMERNDFPDLPEFSEPDRSTPTALFNAMMAPIMPYGIRGVIWYQGESNTGYPDQYRTLFPALIRDWRKWWRQGDFPFYFAQLAPFAYEPDRGRPAALRDAQRDSLDVSNTGLVVTLDIGNATDIHPKNKQEVGRRFALWALARDYGRDELVYSGPLDKSVEVEGATLRIRFDHLGGGLVAAEGGLRHFELAGPDLRWHAAEAEIDADTVLVRSEAVPNPKRVRYCGGAADVGTLFNREGLPAASFTR